MQTKEKIAQEIKRRDLNGMTMRKGRGNRRQFRKVSKRNCLQTETDTATNRLNDV